jgi:hypothetical protein
MSGGIGVELNGIKLKTLSIEYGNTSLNPATNHKQYEIILGAFLSSKRARHIAVITYAPVRLMFNIVRKILSIITAPFMFFYQTF